MAQDLNDEEIRIWMQENENQIAAIIERKGSFSELTSEDMARYREKLDADAETNSKNWRSWRENYTYIMQGAHDRSKGYTNLISIAGYAGFFWLWDKVTPIMSPFYFTATGLCLTLSLAFFVSSEVLVMGLTGTLLLRRSHSAKNWTLRTKLGHF